MLSLTKSSILSRVAQTPRRAPVVIAVSSPKGSTGKTTLAINLAAEIASNRFRVLLIDGDLESGAIANHFMLTELPAGVPGALRIASQNRFDKDQLERLSVALPKSTLRVMPSGNASANLDFDPMAVSQILEVAKTEFDFTVIDCGQLEPKFKDHPSQSFVEEVLRHSDKQVIVCLADPIGIFRLLGQQERIVELCQEPLTVMNRVRNSVIASAKREIEITLQRLSSLPSATFIPDDPSQIDQALKTGVPAVLLSRSGQFRAAITGFVRAEILGTKGRLDSRVAKLG
jgi:MinD-like ATPase involved in chromosome partitioning or flagellar assembly